VNVDSRKVIIIAPLSDERRQELLARLVTEPSDTKLALEFGVSRKALWRMRQTLKAPSRPVAKAQPVITPPAPVAKALPKVVIPASPVPRVTAPKVLKAPPVSPPQTRTAPTLVPPLSEDPRPKVDVEPVILSTYFALQILRGESYKHVANAVLAEAESKSILFRKLQVLDLLSVGTTVFVRFRSDLPDAAKALRALRNRALIASDRSGTYTVTFPDGRSGKYPGATMHSSPKIGFGHTYAGTRIKLWGRQFSPQDNQVKS